MQKAKGPKIKNHTTLIDAAEDLVKAATRIPEVSRVVPGFIKTGIKALHHHQNRVKITHQEGCIVLVVRGRISVQEIRVYADDTQIVLEKLAREALEQDFQIEFGVDEVAEKRREQRRFPMR